MAIQSVIFDDGCDAFVAQLVVIRLKRIADELISCRVVEGYTAAIKTDPDSTLPIFRNTQDGIVRNAGRIVFIESVAVYLPSRGVDPIHARIDGANPYVSSGVLEQNFDAIAADTVRVVRVVPQIFKAIRAAVVNTYTGFGSYP